MKVSENELTKGTEKDLGFGQNFMNINKFVACKSDKIELLHLWESHPNCQPVSQEAWHTFPF
jgi:hypothetical protein